MNISVEFLHFKKLLLFLNMQGKGQKIQPKSSEEIEVQILIIRENAMTFKLNTLSSAQLPSLLQILVYN